MPYVVLKFEKLEAGSQTILKDDTSCKHASSATQGAYIKIDKHNIYMITKIILKTRWSQIALSCGAAFGKRIR
jgi:hypothetical protein